MTREQPHKNPAASIRARLLSLSQEKGEDYQRVLGRFAIERFLYRLGTSLYRDRFVLKGATLFTLWTGETHRPTKDLDLLGWGSSAIADVEQVVRAICEVAEDDGILFDSQSVEGTRIKEDDEYDGVRIKFRAQLAGARIPLQVDIGFGDAVYPEPANVSADHPSLSTGGVDCRKAARDGSARHSQQPNEGLLRRLVHGKCLDVQSGVVA
jgi:hypothetical protein